MHHFVSEDENREQHEATYIYRDMGDRLDVIWQVDTPAVSRLQSTSFLYEQPPYVCTYLW